MAMAESFVPPTSSTRRKRSCPEENRSVRCTKRRVTPNVTKRAVRFSTHTTEQPAVNLFEGLNATEEDALRATLWYSRDDFGLFLNDRMQTMRVWRAVGGNTRLLEPNYCLRGLESFQSTLMNGELQLKRTQHQAAVLNEQERQRRTNTRDADKLAQASMEHSAWALTRASRYGLKDAVEARAACQLSASSSASSLESTDSSMPHKQLPSFSSLCSKVPSLAPTTPTPSSLMSLRSMMLPKLRSSSSTAASREFLAKFYPSGATNTRPTTASQPNKVDVSQLKRMNMQFLQGLMNHTPTPLRQVGTLDLLNEALNSTEDASL